MRKVFNRILTACALAFAPVLAFAQFSVDTSEALTNLGLGLAAIGAVGAVKLGMAGASIVYAWVKGSIFS